MNIGAGLNNGTHLGGDGLNIGEGLSERPISPNADALLLETSDYFLLEDDSFILLE